MHQHRLNPENRHNPENPDSERQKRGNALYHSPPCGYCLKASMTAAPLDCGSSPQSRGEWWGDNKTDQPYSSSPLMEEESKVRVNKTVSTHRHTGFKAVSTGQGDNKSKTTPKNFCELLRNHCNVCDIVIMLNI